MLNAILMMLVLGALLGLGLGRYAGANLIEVGGVSVEVRQGLQG